MKTTSLSAPVPLHLTLDVVEFRAANTGVFQTITPGQYPGDWELTIPSGCCCCCCGVDSSVQAG